MKIHADQVSIGWIGTFDDDEWDDAGSFIEEKAADRGLDAWVIAEALRCKHKIETADMALNYANQFTEILEKAQQVRADQRKKRMMSQVPLTG